VAGTITIALDAMGGDHGPSVTLPGAAQALADTPNLQVIIFGDERIITPILSGLPKLKAKSEIHHTDIVVNNDDKPSQALRRARGSSMMLAIEAVRDGRANAAVSAGNTGALMALSKMVLKSVEGVHRPAICSVFPTISGEPTIMLDLGANVLVDAENLVQFAVMGQVFASAYKEKARPTVGLLNVGTEEKKGPDHVRKASKILSQIDFSADYVGFVEGNDITKGEVDVIVSDGYAGNIALKAVEGVGKMANQFFREAFKSSPLAMLGALISYGALKTLKQRIDPRRYNGGVFLGLNGICVKSHGSSDEIGTASAIKLAVRLAEKGFIESVSRDISHVMNQETVLAEGL